MTRLRCTIDLFKLCGFLPNRSVFRFNTSVFLKINLSPTNADSADLINANITQVSLNLFLK